MRETLCNIVINVDILKTYIITTVIVIYYTKYLYNTSKYSIYYGWLITDKISISKVKAIFDQENIENNDPRPY